METVTDHGQFLDRPARLACSLSASQFEIATEELQATGLIVSLDNRAWRVTEAGRRYQADC